jgi:hypothetical protein
VEDEDGVRDPAPEDESLRRHAVDLSAAREELRLETDLLSGKDGPAELRTLDHREEGPSSLADHRDESPAGGLPHRLDQEDARDDGKARKVVGKETVVRLEA